MSADTLCFIDGGAGHKADTSARSNTSKADDLRSLEAEERHQKSNAVDPIGI
jgi:hypothetical protein